MSLYHRVHLLVFRSMDFQRNAVMLSYLIHKLIRGLGQTAGVDSEDPHGWINPPRHINNYQTIGLETGTDRDSAAKAFECPADYVLRLLIVKLNRQFPNLKLIQHDVSFHVHSFPLRTRLSHRGSRTVLSLVTALPFNRLYYGGDG